MAKTVTLEADNGRKYAFRVAGEVIERREVGSRNWTKTTMRRSHIEAIRQLWAPAGEDVNALTLLREETP